MDVSFCVLYSPTAAIDEDTTSPLCLREWQYLYEGSRCPQSAEELAAKPVGFAGAATRQLVMATGAVHPDRDLPLDGPVYCRYGPAVPLYLP